VRFCFKEPILLESAQGFPPESILFHKRKQSGKPTHVGLGRATIQETATGRELPQSVVMAVKAQSYLPEIVRALEAGGAAADLLDSGHEQADE